MLLDGRDLRPELVDSIVDASAFVVLSKPNTLVGHYFRDGTRTQADGSALKELSASLARWRYEHV